MGSFLFVFMLIHLIRITVFSYRLTKPDFAIKAKRGPERRFVDM